ncbi:MAG: histidine triad nucleotide-binding protein [Clostridia bacterium]
MEDCLFCKIVKGDVPSKVVYETEDVLVFEDIHPVAPVHVLVIPKVHIQDMNYINEDNSRIVSKIYEAIAHVAKELNIDKEGYRVICNCGENGGQVVNHLHYHLLGGKHLGMKLVKE